MTLLAVAASATVSIGYFSPQFVLFGIGPALIVLGSFIFNDAADVESDKALGRKDRPLASGAIPQKLALAASILLLIVGLLVCLAAGTLAFKIALAYCLLSLAYSLALKKIPLAGNVVVATTYAVSFAFGNAVAIDSLGPNLNLSLLAFPWDPLVLCFAGFAFLAGLGREFIITLRDVKGDKKIGAFTLPMAIGAKLTVWLACLLLLLAVALTGMGLPFATNLFVYFGFVGACNLLLLYSIVQVLKDASFSSLSKVRNYTLWGFQLALVGFLVMAGLAALSSA